MRNFFVRMFEGRYGFDDFSRFLNISAIFIIVISIFAGRGPFGSFIQLLGLFVALYSYYRAFSRKHYKRAKENVAYQKWSGKVHRRYEGLKIRFTQRKDYKFFKCPSCKATLRVPKGKGKIIVTCRKCGNRIEKKT